MKTVTKTVTDMIANNEDAPLPMDVIPNNMGINLCSVEAMTWTKQDDGQLVSLTIHFLPGETEKEEGKDKWQAFLNHLQKCKPRVPVTIVPIIDVLPCVHGIGHKILNFGTISKTVSLEYVRKYNPRIGGLYVAYQDGRESYIEMEETS